MKKCNEVIAEWRNECSKPWKIVFGIQIDKDDFNEMISEMEKLQHDYELLNNSNENLLKCIKDFMIFELDMLLDKQGGSRNHYEQSLLLGEINFIVKLNRFLNET